MPGVARGNDPVQGTDIHVVLVPAAAGAPVPTPTPHPFTGLLTTALSPDVTVNGLPVATVDSVAQNQPPHLPIGGPSFQRPPTNRGRVVRGSTSVFVNGKPVARAGDPVSTCNDPVAAPTSTIAAGSLDVMSS